MSLLKIAQIGHPVLRQTARALTVDEINSSSIQHFIDDMVESMRDANGAGLAANQVYNPIQICVLEVENNPRYPYKPRIPLEVLINPIITVLSDEQFENFEGCLSVPNIRGRVRRHAEIQMDYIDREGTPHQKTIRGITAGTYQHEVDHLQGKVFLDRVFDSSSLCTWQEFERHYRDDFVKEAEAVVAKYGS
jgi:peptide deformylase